MCGSGSRGSLYICLHHQRPQVQSPLLPRLHCFWCGQCWRCICVSTGKYHIHSAYNATLDSHTSLPLPSCQNLAYEIILTLGQAFEVAYQLALQARKSGHGSSTLPESFDSKPSKPVPKPRVNIRKSVSIAASQPHSLLKGKSILIWNSHQQLRSFLKVPHGVDDNISMNWILYILQLFYDKRKV